MSDGLKGLVAVFFTVMAIIGMAKYRPFKVEYKPLYKVGDCITLNEDKEAWEEPYPYVKRIEEIGNKAYRTTLFYKGVFVTDKHTVSFFLASNSVIVRCPNAK